MPGQQGVKQHQEETDWISDGFILPPETSQRLDVLQLGQDRVQDIGKDFMGNKKTSKRKEKQKYNYRTIIKFTQIQSGHNFVPSIIQSPTMQILGSCNVPPTSRLQTGKRHTEPLKNVTFSSNDYSEEMLIPNSINCLRGAQALEGTLVSD